MKNKYAFPMIVLLFTISAGAVTAYEPTAAIESAVHALSRNFTLSREEIKNYYKITWEFQIFDEDDQPLIIQFKSARFLSYCEVILGSESLQIIKSKCFSHREIH